MASSPPTATARPAAATSLALGAARAVLGAALLSSLWACTPFAIQGEGPTAGVQPLPATEATVQSKVDHGQISGEELELTPAEPDRFIEEELARFQALGEWEPDGGSSEELVDTTYDFPVIINKHVQFYLDFFQAEMRPSFSRWLASSGRYVPMIQEHLREAGLPEDLAYLPMIESGYNLTAYSRARAVGPWQFMAPTARQYGLVINDYVDERRDPFRSTQAAVTFLSDLHNEFGCWQLAVAAYNAGGGRIRGAIRRFDSDNFWEISQNNHLSLETRHYVPKLIAAIIIAKNPAAYGFDNITYDEPLRYETMVVPRWTSLEAVALAGDLDLEELHDLNRQLRRLVTPPEAATYTLRLPADSKARVAENLPRVQAVAQVDYRTHVVRQGDTLTRICNTYNINKNTLLKANSLRSEQLVIGQRLRIPVQTTAYKLLDKGAGPDSRQAGLLGGGAGGLVLHTVQPGESLWTLSRRYGVDAKTIAAWNGLNDPSRIRAGQQLALYFAPAPAGGGQPSLAAAASKRPPTAEAEITYYRVRGGDTLWSIAQKFQTTTRQIQEWNQLNGDLIHPGKQLILRLAEFTS